MIKAIDTVIHSSLPQEKKLEEIQRISSQARPNEHGEMPQL